MNASDTSLGDMILFKLKNISGYELEKYYDVSGGIHNRIKLAAENATDLESLLEAAKTKKYTMARLKRLCLYALFDVTREMYDEAVKCPPYITILALNKDRKDILSAVSMVCKNVLTRYSDVSRADKEIRFLVKLDFTTQGTLDIINRSTNYIKKMLIV
jgi:Predicted nucleotidyltransferase